MSLHTRRLRTPAILVAALATLLAFAATASAETRTGASTTVITENFPAGEVTLVKADASYESAGGSVVFNVTTATGPQPAGEGVILAALTTSATCTGQKTGRAIVRQLLENPPPVLEFLDKLSSSTPTAAAGNPLAPQALPATKAVNGTTTTLSARSSVIANAGFNCAIVAASEAGEGREEVEGLPFEEEHPGATFMSFPISAPSAPPVVTPTTSTPPAATPLAPPHLKIAKLKPVSLKTGTRRSVRVKVTNTGATGTGRGSLRVKTTKGVMVKPERQQLPVLGPGASRTVTVRVRLTAKAKRRSKLKLTAAASGVTATRPLVLRAKG